MGSAAAVKENDVRAVGPRRAVRRHLAALLIGLAALLMACSGPDQSSDLMEAEAIVSDFILSWDEATHLSRPGGSSLSILPAVT